MVLPLATMTAAVLPIWAWAALPAPCPNPTTTVRAGEFPPLEAPWDPVPIWPAAAAEAAARPRWETTVAVPRALRLEHLFTTG